MTGEEFQKDYQLQDKIDDGQVVSHRATDSSGEPVLVHFLVKDVAGSRTSLLNYLPRLDSTRAALIRTLTEVDGTTVLVTEPLEGFTTLPAWLEEAAGGKVVRDPGVYTRLLGNASPTEALGETTILDPSTESEGLGPEAPTPPTDPQSDGSASDPAILETRVLDTGGLTVEPPVEPEPEPELETEPEPEPEIDAEPEPKPEPEPEPEPGPGPAKPFSPKKTGRPGAFTMVFGEDHGLRDASPDDVPALAETRVTPTSADNNQAKGPAKGGPASGGRTPPPSSSPDLAETRITPISGTDPGAKVRPPAKDAPPSGGSTDPGGPADPGGPPGTQDPPPPERTSTPRPAPRPSPSGLSISPVAVVVLVVFALIVGIVAGVFLLG